jgi:MSHA pilin protein MshA
LYTLAKLRLIKVINGTINSKGGDSVKNLRSNAGFTLIELVLVILILGILAVTAIPKFIDLSSNAKTASERGVVGAVRGGIAIVHASNVVAGSNTFPATLDNFAAPVTASGTNLLFSIVLDPGVDDAGWSKPTATTYKGPAGTTYTYTAAQGTFQ